jgi:hypothetical protein
MTLFDTFGDSRNNDSRTESTGRGMPPRAAVPESLEARAMGRIQQCVMDVLSIANKTEDFGQAKKRIEQLFVVSKAQHRGHLAVAQRVRDQINQAYDNVLQDAQPCVDRVLEWLDREHLQQHQHTD